MPGRPNSRAEVVCGRTYAAHWYGFRSGPKKRDNGSDIPTVAWCFELRWLPPIRVNEDDPDNMPATFHLVPQER